MTSSFVCEKNKFSRYAKKFYTEDDILIYTLYVSNIPESVCANKLKKYFEKYGDVETLRYKKKYKTLEGNRNRAIVQFKKPESASKVLRIRAHKIEDTSLIVREADGWIQPHRKRLKPLIKIEDSDAENFHILKLNDYCMFNIFSYLPYQDQVRMATLCERFKKIFIMMSKNLKSLKLNSANIYKLSILEIYESFTIIGKFIESLEIDCRINKFNRIYDFILKYFPNLKTLYFENLNEKFRNSNKEIPMLLKKLTHLTLKNCSITDEQIKKFIKLERLEYLDLSENEELVGKHLHNMKKLRHLSLNNCKKLETSNLKPILEKVPLRALKVIGIRNADAIASPFFPFAQLELNEFHFTSYRPENSFLKFIPTFKNIKRIRIFFMQLEKDDTGLRDFLRSCVENKCDKLEYLGLISQHLNLNNDNIYNLVQLTNLRELEINRLTNADCLFWTKLCNINQLEILNFYCDHEYFDENEFISWIKKTKNIKQIIAKFERKIIKPDFVLSVIDVLKEMYTNKRKIKVHIFGILRKDGKSNANTSILKDEKYLAHKHFVEIHLSEDGILDDEINISKFRESQVNGTIDDDDDSD